MERHPWGFSTNSTHWPSSGHMPASFLASQLPFQLIYSHLCRKVHVMGIDCICSISAPRAFRKKAQSRVVCTVITTAIQWQVETLHSGCALGSFPSGFATTRSRCLLSKSSLRFHEIARVQAWHFNKILRKARKLTSMTCICLWGYC